MKLFIFFLTTVGLMAQSASAFLYRGTQYVNCNNCQSESQFHAAAENNIGLGIRVVVVNSERAIQTNQLSPNIRTFRRSFTEPGDDLRGGGIQPRRLQSPLRSTLPELQLSMEMNLVTTSADDMLAFGAFVDGAAGHAMPQYSGAVELSLPQTEWEYTPRLTEVRDEAFVAQYSTLINDTLSAMTINPFWFTQKALTVRVITGNSCIVTLVNTGSNAQPSWQHVLTRYIPLQNMLVEPSYVTESGVQLSELEGKTCEPFSYSPYAKAGLLCLSTDGSPYAKRMIPVGSDHDQSPCLPVEPQCNDDGNFFIGVGTIGGGIGDEGY